MKTNFALRQRQILWLLHQITSSDEVDEFAKGVVFRFPVSLQAANAGLVGEPKRAAERVG